MRLKSKRLISLLLAGSMMVSMLPASTVTAFAETTATATVSSADATEEMPLVKVSTSGGLEQAFKDQLGEDKITTITKLAVETTGDAKLNGDDFKFLSCVTPLGNNQGNSTYNTSYGLSSLVELDLTNASCENDAIPESAFQNNTVIEIIYLPKNLKSIERSAFNCASNTNSDGLKHNKISYVGSRDGVPGSKIVFPATLEKIGQSAFWYDRNITGELELPASLKTLGSHAFVGTKVSGNIKIKGDVTLEASASGAENASIFQETNINSIEFGNGIQTISNSICKKCPNLESIVIPQSVTVIQPYAFFDAGKVENIILNRSDVTIYKGAFCNDENKVYTIYFQSEQAQKDTSDSNNYNKWSNSAILLNTNGGTVTPESDTVTYGNVTLYVPTKENAKFLGWYDGNTPLTSESTIASNHFYTAKWAEARTVTFDLNGVEGKGPDAQTVYEGDKVTAPKAPTADGYKFDGWYTDKDCTASKEFKFADAEGATTIATDTIIYAKWTPYETKVEPKVEANADPASKTVEITVDVEAAPTELVGATATLNFTDAKGNDDSANVAEVAVDGKKLEKDENDKYTAKLSDLMQKTSDASENSAETVMLADVNEVVPSTVKGTARLTVTYKTPGKHRVEIVLNAKNGDVICKKPATVEIAPEPGTLNLTGCTAKLEDGTPVENGAKVPVGAEVTVTFEQDADSDLVLNGWKVTPETLTDTNDKLVKDITADTFTFVMPETDEGVTIEALTKAKAAAAAEDDSLDAAAVVTGVVLGTGTAILAYHIGTEVYAEQVLGKGVAIPRTREEVALKAWELAGEPAVELNGEPLSEAAQAEKWAVESGLMQNDAEGSFNGAKKMNKLKALRVLDAAKKLA